MKAKYCTNGFWKNSKQTMTQSKNIIYTVIT